MFNEMNEEVIQKKSPPFPVPPIPYGNFGLEMPHLLTRNSYNTGASTIGVPVFGDLYLFGEKQAGEVFGPFAIIYMYGVYNKAYVSLGATAYDFGTNNYIVASSASTAYLNGSMGSVKAAGSTVYVDGSLNGVTLRDESKATINGSSNTADLDQQSIVIINGFSNKANLKDQSTCILNGFSNKVFLAGKSTGILNGKDNFVEVTGGSVTKLIGDNNTVGLYQNSYAALFGGNEKANIFSPDAVLYINDPKQIIKFSYMDISGGRGDPSKEEVNVYVTHGDPTTVLDISGFDKKIALNVYADTPGEVSILARGDQTNFHFICNIADPVASRVDKLLQEIASAAIPEGGASATGIYINRSSSHVTGAVTVATSALPLH